MKRLAGLLLLSTLLTACASQPAPEQRPYTDAEIRQFSLEMLSRSGLPYEDYTRIEKALRDPRPATMKAASNEG